MTIDLLIVIILMVIIILMIFKEYTKSKILVERISIILWYLVCFTPIIIYYLDYFNLPSSWKMTKNVDSREWLGFLANYTSSVVGAIIGGMITIFVARYQIKENNEDNEKRDKENLRLQNMPILSFSLNNDEFPVKNENIISTRFDDATVYDLNIFIKNIGTNNIKNIKIDFNSEIINNKKLRLVGEDTLVVLEKEKEIVIQKSFFLEPTETPYKIYITVYYQDVLNNWYEQELEIDYIANTTFEYNRNLGKIKYKVKEEKLIDFLEETSENINKGDK